MMVQLETKWRPSPEQIKMAEVLVNPEDRRTRSEKMIDVGVSRSTFYRMLKDKNFLNYLREQIDNMTDGELADVWKAHIAKCKTGDVPAIKLFYEMKGMYTERRELSGPKGGPIEVVNTTNISNLSEEDLRLMVEIMEKCQVTGEIMDI